MDYPCPKEDEIFAKVNQNCGAAVLSKWQKFIKFLEPLANITINTFWDVYNIYEPIVAEWNHKDQHPPPSWVNDSVYENIVELYDECTKCDYSTSEWQRIRGSTMKFSNKYAIF